MRFKLLSPSADARFIGNVRKAILISLHTDYQERLCLPLQNATYLALESKDGIVGMAEALPLMDLFPLINTCPFQNHLTDEIIENYNSICHLRTIYVYPEFRKSFHYLYLALGMTKIFSWRNCKFATAVTAARDPGLAKLYCRTGGTLLGNFQYSGVENEFSLYGFRGADLLSHPLTARVEIYLKASGLTTGLVNPTGHKSVYR